MKKIFFSVFFLTFLFVNSLKASEFAIINLEEIIKNSTAMNKFQKTLEVKQEKIKKEMELEEKKLMDEKNSIESEIKTLSQATAQEKIKNFEVKVVEFQRKIKEKSSELEKEYLDALMFVNENIKEIILELKEDKNSKYQFKIALPSSSVIYYENELDISKEVLSRLNKKVKEIKQISTKNKK